LPLADGIDNFKGGPNYLSLFVIFNLGLTLQPAQGLYLLRFAPQKPKAYRENGKENRLVEGVPEKFTVSGIKIDKQKGQPEAFGFLYLMQSCASCDAIREKFAPANTLGRWVGKPFAHRNPQAFVPLPLFNEIFPVHENPVIIGQRPEAPVELPVGVF
jgi:hypothetical protein